MSPWSLASIYLLSWSYYASFGGWVLLGMMALFAAQQDSPFLPLGCLLCHGFPPGQLRVRTLKGLF